MMQSFIVEMSFFSQNKNKNERSYRVGVFTQHIQFHSLIIHVFETHRKHEIYYQSIFNVKHNFS